MDTHETALMNAHFWSLSIEEQFYLAWPAILLIARPKRALWIAIAAAAFVVINRAIHAGQLSGLPFAATVQTYYRADSILIGCCAALITPAEVSDTGMDGLAACRSVCFIPRTGIQLHFRRGKRRHRANSVCHLEQPDRDRTAHS